MKNGRQRLPCASRKGAPDPRRPDYLHRRYFTALTEDRPYRKGMARQAAYRLWADVINGALDSDVSRFCATMRKRYTPSFFQTLPLCIASAASEAGRRRGGAEFYNQNSFICMQRKFTVRIATITNWAYGITVGLTLASGSAMLVASSADRVERQAVQQRRSLIPLSDEVENDARRCLTSPGCT